MATIRDRGLESIKVEIQFNLNQDNTNQEAQVDKDRLLEPDMYFQQIKKKFQMKKH